MSFRKTLGRITFRIEREAINFFKSNFKKRGFWDKQLSPWLQRKDKKTHPLLEKSGKLFRSIRTIKRTISEIIIESDTEYGHFHNEGTDELPKRQFLGNSSELDKRMKKIINEEIIRLFKKSRKK